MAAAIFYFFINFVPIIFAIFYSQPKLGSKQVNQTILDAAPWKVKLMLLKDVDPRFISSSPKPEDNRIIEVNSRRVGIQALAQGEDYPKDDIPLLNPEGELVYPTMNEELSMRLKLFRLMYEVVRDSDLKVRRAELIRVHYMNSSAWEVGYLMGEVQEKFDIINEFTRTLDKFYDAWKPIEHINAYEQIATYAIQINQLVDLIQTSSKRV